MEGGEDISDEPIPNRKYTRVIYPYITDIVSYLTPYGPTSKFSTNLTHGILSTSRVEVINDETYTD